MGRKQLAIGDKKVTIFFSISLSMLERIKKLRLRNTSEFIRNSINRELSRLDGINPEIEHDAIALQEAIDRYESLDGEKTHLENTITTLKEKISKQKLKKGDKP